MKRILLGAVPLLLLSLCVNAQAPSPAKRTPICVSYADKDIVGVSFVYELKEALNRSSRYHYVQGTPDSGWCLHITTLDPYEGKSASGYNAIVAVTVTFSVPSEPWRYFISQGLLSVGKIRTADMAQSFLAQVAETIDSKK
jgi:hypothetical protein